MHQRHAASPTTLALTGSKETMSSNSANAACHLVRVVATSAVPFRGSVNRDICALPPCAHSARLAGAWQVGVSLLVNTLVLSNRGVSLQPELRQRQAAEGAARYGPCVETRELLS